LDSFIYNIEIVGACNLKCPSCPVGNVLISDLSEPRPKGLMPPERFYRILEKIGHEHPPDRETHVRLYNWGEPILHPRVGDFISAINCAGFKSGISTNFNRVKNMEAVVRSNPYQFVISLSGYSQATYSQTHQGGNIETVKRNMAALRGLMTEYGSSSQVAVAYHAYRHNCGHDYTEMRSLCADLDFHFHSYWAWFNPLEKLLLYLAGNPLPEDQKLIQLLIVDPREHMNIVRRNVERDTDCVLRSNGANIGVDGSVELCCATYDPSSTVAPDFLQISHDEMQRLRYQSPVCTPCMNQQVHQLYAQTGYAELCAIGNQVLAHLGVENRLHPDVADCPVCNPAVPSGPLDRLGAVTPNIPTSA
jgi:MoaA/NifB/PqqE/SkfB family radical SAM enzyme